VKRCTAAKRRKNKAVGKIALEAPAPKGRKKMPHTSSNLLVHLIFSTKQRHPSIAPETKDDLFAYMGGIIREMHGVALIVNGTTDHVHLLARIPPVCSVAEMTRILKANSSRWAHEKWPGHRAFSWQTG